MNFFRSAKPKPPPPQPKAPPVSVGQEAAETIKKLRTDIDQLEKRRKYMDTQINAQDEVIRDKVRKKDKGGAKMALMRKNQMVKNSTQVDNQIMALESQCM